MIRNEELHDSDEEAAVELEMKNIEKLKEEQLRIDEISEKEIWETSDNSGLQRNSDILSFFLKPLNTFEPLRLTGGMEDFTTEDNVSISDQPEEQPYGQESTTKSRLLHRVMRYGQQFILITCWLIFSLFLMMNKEYDADSSMLTIPQGKDGIRYRIAKEILGSSLHLRLQGPFTRSSFKFDNLKIDHMDTPHLSVELQEIDEKGLINSTRSVVSVPVLKTHVIEELEKIIENIDEAKQYQLHFQSSYNESLALELAYGFTTLTRSKGRTLALLLLAIIYIHIMFELIHRSLAGVMCCSLGIGIMAALHLRPSLELVFNEWGNIDTIMIFFGISIIIEMLAETGLQDHLAAVSYEFSNGHIWPMLNCILLTTFALSSLLDDLLLVLFVAPICLRLCEIMQLHCTPVLSCLIVAINVGSCLTPISSISINMIANSPFIPREQFTLGIFIIHMFPAAVLVLAQSYIQLRLQFRDSEKIRTYEPFLILRLRRLIKLWRKASDRMGNYTLDERLARKAVDLRVHSLRRRLKRLGKMPEKPLGFMERVKDLRENYPIQKIPLLLAALLALFVTLLFSLLSRFPNVIYISNGWIATLAALLALSCSNYEDIDGIMSRIDWGTMLFFLTLFILMQVLIFLGLLENIGLMLQHFILNVSENYRLTIAILTIIWTAAILSTFMDNVPVADMMMRIIGTITRNQVINLPLMPLIWALALGCSLGGNGSIVGAFANIACAGVASRHGYRFTYFGYFKIGFFIMIGNIVVASCYLLLAHVGFEWH